MSDSKQVDFDGQVHCSDIQVVEIKLFSDKLLAFPNPDTGDYIRIREVEETDLVQTRLIDVLGRYYSPQFKYNQNVLTLSTQNLNSDTYYLISTKGKLSLVIAK